MLLPPKNRNLHGQGRNHLNSTLITVRTPQPTCPVIGALIRVFYNGGLSLFRVRLKNIQEADLYTQVASITYILIKNNRSEHLFSC
jgi:hypothetical protein